MSKFQVGDILMHLGSSDMALVTEVTENFYRLLWSAPYGYEERYEIRPIEHYCELVTDIFRSF